MHKFFALLFLTLGGAAGIGGAVVIRDHPWVKVDPTSQVTTAAPEIDPAGAASALTLLVGGLAALRGRRQKN
jgi:hypothetical protein